MDRKVSLRLYVAGDAPHSAAARANIRLLLADVPPDRVALEVIDVFEAPDRAREDGLLVTPMLIRLSPKPVRRIVGDLSERERVWAALDLAAAVGGVRK